MIPNTTQSNTLAALRAFLLSILPAGMEVVRGQDNRVPEPQGSDFVTMTPILRERLSTNVPTAADVAFIGSITGTTLTVTTIQLGTISLGATLFGQGIISGTTIVALGTGTGGVGTYTVSASQTVASEQMACGTQSILQPTKVTIQLDVHGPNSPDNAQLIATLFRDEYAIQQFATSGYSVVPMYAEDPRQIPFMDGEQQFEDRWVVDCVMQVNAAVTVPQQYASQLDVGLKEVDTTFPPGA